MSGVPSSPVTPSPALKAPGTGLTGGPPPPPTASAAPHIPAGDTTHRLGQLPLWSRLEQQQQQQQQQQGGGDADGGADGEEEEEEAVTHLPRSRRGKSAIRRVSVLDPQVCEWVCLIPCMCVLARLCCVLCCEECSHVRSKLKSVRFAVHCQCYSLTQFKQLNCCAYIIYRVGQNRIYIPRIFEDFSTE